MMTKHISSFALGKSSSILGGRYQARWETQARSVSGAAEKDLSHSPVPLPPDTDLTCISLVPETQPGGQVSFQVKGCSHSKNRECCLLT